jgi:hypothetical protein
MKKLIIFSVFVILITLLMASPALAIPGKGAVKGQVTAVDRDAGTLTIETKRGEIVTVFVPPDFDIKAIEVDDWVLVKAAGGEGDSIEAAWVEAAWVKQVGKGRGKNDDQDKPEGKKENSAFCDEGKQQKPHPLAAKVSEHFGVTEDTVMGYFCDGYGMGAIMLAFNTSKLESADLAEKLLADRALGKGWGQIWKDLDLIGSEKEGHSPPGLLNRPDHAGSKE